jgi:LacI family transcriptional regulator
MTPAPSIKQVAAAAGVSVGTVSNVLNKPDVVAEATRLRVNAVIAELGFVRNESARQLRAGSSRAVGLLVLDAANPFFADVARGVEDTVQQVGGVVLLGNSAGDDERERRYLELFQEQRVRGVLIAPTGAEAPPLESLTRRGIPVVFVDRYREDGAYSSVSVDDVAGGRIAAQHLVDTGHRRIAFVGGPSSLRQVRDRLHGAEEVVGGTKAGRLLVISIPALTTAAGRTAADEIAGLPLRQRPTAVFAANDLVAIGLLGGLLGRGLKVPEDVAIVGYDDIEFAEAAAVPLSSVRQPRIELGRCAAELLFEQIKARDEGKPVEVKQVQFDCQLVVRRSSAPTRRGARP